MDFLLVTATHCVISDHEVVAYLYILGGTRRSLTCLVDAQLNVASSLVSVGDTVCRTVMVVGFTACSQASSRRNGKGSFEK